jgi:hypothetical protein
MTLRYGYSTLMSIYWSSRCQLGVRTRDIVCWWASSGGLILKVVHGEVITRSIWFLFWEWSSSNGINEQSSCGYYYGQGIVLQTMRKIRWAEKLKPICSILVRNTINLWFWGRDSGYIKVKQERLVVQRPKINLLPEGSGICQRHGDKSDAYLG